MLTLEVSSYVFLGRMKSQQAWGELRPRSCPGLVHRVGNYSLASLVENCAWAMSQNEHCQDSGEYFSGVYLEIWGTRPRVPTNERSAESLVRSPVLEWLAPTYVKAMRLARSAADGSDRQPRVLRSWEGRWLPAPLAVFSCGSLCPSYLTSSMLCMP